MTPSPLPFPFTISFHYFCDHRCWRCQLSDRCAVFARWQKLSKRKRLHFTGPAGRVASVLAVAMQVTIEEAAVITRRNRTDHAARGAPRCRPPWIRRCCPVESDRSMQARQDPVVARSAEYAQSCWPALQTIRPILAARGEQAAVDVTDRLEEMCPTIASKIFRADLGHVQHQRRPERRAMRRERVSQSRAAADRRIAAGLARTDETRSGDRRRPAGAVRRDARRDRDRPARSGFPARSNSFDRASTRAWPTRTARNWHTRCDKPPRVRSVR